MTKVLGLNASLDHTKDAKKRDGFNRALNPAYSLVMVDNATDIKRINVWAAENPYTNTIGRIYYEKDGGMHLKPTGKGDEHKEFTVDPIDYLNMVCEFAPEVWANIMNEPMGKGDDVEGQANLDRLATWFILYMDGAILKKRKSVLFNWGDRHPAIINGMWDVRWHGALKRAAIYPDLFMIGMHFYGPDDVTEHLEAYVTTCEYLGITPIPVVGTEFGIDSTGQGDSLNGQNSRNMQGALFAEWTEDTINGQLAPYIKRRIVVGLCTFTWSNHPDWKPFDVTDDIDWQTAMIAAKFTTKEVPIVVAPSLHPFPADFATRSVQRYVKATGSQFVRLDPKRGAQFVNGAVITNKPVSVDVILPENLKPDEIYREVSGNSVGNWLPVQVGRDQGWVLDISLRFSETIDALTTTEMPIVNIPPKADLNLPPLPPINVPTPLPPLESNADIMLFMTALAQRYRDSSTRKKVEADDELKFAQYIEHLVGLSPAAQ